MAYQKIYHTIINNRIQNPPIGYVERHHIIPRSLGGTDVAENLVRLTAREHFICHMLLVKMQVPNTPNYHKMVNATIIMRASNSKMSRYINNRLYATLREAYSIKKSMDQSGSKNNNFGSKWVTNITTSVTYKIRGDLPDGCLWGRNQILSKCERCLVEFQTSKVESRKKCPSCIEYVKQNTKPKSIKSPKPEQTKPVYTYSCANCNAIFESVDNKRKYCSNKSCILKGNSKKISDGAGNVFASLTDAAKHYKLTVEAIRQRIRSTSSTFRYLSE